MAKKEDNKFLTNDELKFIQEGTAAFTRIKIAIGDLELKKESLLKEASAIVEAFTANEKALIEKYGEDAVINTQTGEVTKKQK